MLLKKLIKLQLKHLLKLIKKLIGAEVNNSSISAIVDDLYQRKMEINIMAIDSTFWVAVSFFIFFGGLIYLKVPQKINEILK